MDHQPYGFELFIFRRYGEVEMNSSPLYRILSWVTALLVPVALVLTAVRLMFVPAYLTLEYNAPGFPADPFGFTKEERLQYANIASQYLLNSAGIEFLGDQKFKDGKPMYNERELKHMVDVKVTVTAALNVWLISLAGLLVLGLWAWFGGWRGDYIAGLNRGGWLTVILPGLVIVLTLFAFGGFFIFFHNMFFESGTWLFYTSDTLIRLFPERFWRDIFIYVGALALGGGLALIFWTRRPKG
jgi:integral membrane protein (TIGR01906 family)